LDKIIERAAQAEAPVPLREPARAAQVYAEDVRPREMPRREEPPRRRDYDNDDYDRKPRKRRESFLSDLFDF
jgi:Zn-finger nucleic acid-binding protein